MALLHVSRANDQINWALGVQNKSFDQELKAPKALYSERLIILSTRLTELSIEPILPQSFLQTPFFLQVTCCVPLNLDKLLAGPASPPVPLQETAVPLSQCQSVPHLSAVTERTWGGQEGTV